VAIAAFTKKTPYLDTEDTLEEVGITRRQLNYWREKELFVPEFGEDAKRFTAKDISLLKFARRLIVEQGFPVEIAKRFIDAAQTSRPWEAARFEEFQYLDIVTGTLRTKKDVERTLWEEFGAAASEEQTEDRLYTLALLLFRILRLRHSDGESFAKRRDEIISMIRSMAFTARIRFDRFTPEGEHEFITDPMIDEEELNLGAGVAESWLKAEYSRLHQFEEGAKRLDLTPEQRRRFWDEATDALISPPLHKTPGINSDSESFDDVPF